MAHIFLSYARVHELVELFEKNLERQGHTVYSDEDFDYRLDAIRAKLREFDAVIVIWSDVSLEHDDRTAVIAAEALRLGRLIQTKAPAVPALLAERIKGAQHRCLAAPITQHSEAPAGFVFIDWRQIGGFGDKSCHLPTEPVRLLLIAGHHVG
jgi:hypothetical protein